MSEFKEKIYQITKTIPKGKVASYGQVALMAGIPRAARQAGWVLNKLEDNSIPWWRVVNNQGKISIKGNKYSALEQKSLLESEGIPINKALTFDIKKYRYIPTNKEIKKLELDQELLDKLFKLI